MTALDVLALRQPVHEQLLKEHVTSEAELLGVDARIAWFDDLPAAYQALAPDRAALLLTTPETPDLTDLPCTAVRLDLGLRSPDRSPQLATHVQGRGVVGVRWAMRTVVHHASWPSHRVAYGEHAEQFGELWLPDTTTTGVPAVVLVHGGYWRSRWQLDLMDALAVDLARRGVASWNIEYRRPDRHGWAATVADVTAAVRYVAELAGSYPVDPGRVGVVGHSAGGQLGPRVTADLVAAGAAVRPSVVVVQAGVVDLVEAQRRDLGEGAVKNALGGTYEEEPETYATSSPLLRLPIGAHQVVVTAQSDSPDLNEMNLRYAAAARDAGDQVTTVHGDGDHFTLIDPRSQLWADTATALTTRLRQGEARP